MLKILLFSGILGLSSISADSDFLFDKDFNPKSPDTSVVKTKTETTADVEDIDEADYELEAMLQDLLLKGLILKKEATEQHLKDYQAMSEELCFYVLDRILENDEDKVVAFYKMLKGLSEAEQILLIPFLDFFLKVTKKKIIDGEDIEDRLSNQVEILQAVLDAFRELVDKDEDAEDEESDESKPEDEDSKELDKLRKELTKGLKSISDLKEKIQGLEENGGVSQLQYKKLYNSQLETLKLLKRLQDKMEALDAKISSVPQVPKPPVEETEDEVDEIDDASPAPDPVQAPGGSENEDADEEDEEESTDYKAPPMMFEYRIYGNDRAGIVNLLNNGNPSNEGEGFFDPRAVKLLDKNGSEWRTRLTKYKFKRMPTELVGAMAESKIKVHIGPEMIALKQTYESFNKAVDAYLEDGGKQCMIDAAKKVPMDWENHIFSCR
jgi:hypothetical protein